VLLTVGTLTAGVLGPTPTGYLVLIAMVYAVWSAFAGLLPSVLGRRLKSVAVFFAAIILLNGATGPGTVLFGIGGVLFTREGFLAGIEYSARLSLMLWGGMLLSRTVPPEGYVDMAEGLTTRRGRPLIAAWMVAICYLPAVVASARRMVLARKARGELIRPGFTSAMFWMTTGAFPFFATALRNSDALAEAMETRHFHPRESRSPFHPGHLRKVDIVMLGVALVSTAAALTGAF
jgi:energy-coupling factor transporter transmembrane protein EcfT